MIRRLRFASLWLLTAVMVFTSAASAQPPPAAALGGGPWTYETFEKRTHIRVSVVTNGLSHPWSLAFLSDGNMLVTERAGRLRIIRDGVLDPRPIAGLPQIYAVHLAGLMDVALHPKFAENKFVYLAYSKEGAQGTTLAVARGRWDGTALADVRDIFVADAWHGGTANVDNASYGSRIAFGRDGMMYVTSGNRNRDLSSDGGQVASEGGQNPATHFGKVLRLRDDGTVPADNPFVGKAGYKPEIYSLGHRNPQGLAVHPQTGALWESEHGPNGGDEVNIILPGRNYGWPLVSYGRNYTGSRVGEHAWREGLEEPVVYWTPSIAPSGMTFYNGDRFPAWKGNLFVGAMRVGQVSGTGHIERITLNDKGQELRHEWLLADLKQRIRDVRQGPDGLLYVLTEEDDAALLRIEPAP
jgi:aldose sugar dehydrogenase